MYASFFFLQICVLPDLSSRPIAIHARFVCSGVQSEALTGNLDTLKQRLARRAAALSEAAQVDCAARQNQSGQLSTYRCELFASSPTSLCPLTILGRAPVGRALLHFKALLRLTLHTLKASCHID
jgi:hypothetical protein